MADTSPKYFRAQAERCRRLADSTLDVRLSDTLRGMAEEYEAKAKELEVKLSDS
jgi:hypothetical protein